MVRRHRPGTWLVAIAALGACGHAAHQDTAARAAAVRGVAETRPGLRELAVAVAAGTIHTVKAGRDEFTVFLGTDETRAVRATVPEFLGAVRALVPARKIASGPTTYLVEWNRLSADGRVLYDIESVYLDYAGDGETRTYDHGTRFEPLSLTGALACYSRVSRGFAEGAAHPWDTREILAVDARTGRPDSLLNYFEESSLVRALQGDPFVRGTMVTQGRRGPEERRRLRRLDAAQSFAQVSRVLEESPSSCQYFWLPGSGQLSRFALFDFDPRTGLASVRMGLGYGCEAARGTFTELGLRLRPKPPFARLLGDLVRREEGLFMKAASVKKD